MGILIDNSGSMADILPRMKTGLLDFARKSQGFEELFVMTFGTSVRVLHDIGQPIRTLETRLEGVRPRGTSVLFDALVEGMRKLDGSEHARKALIVFTDGQDNASSAGFGKVSLEAQRSGVLLYFVPIGSRVLVDENTIEALATGSGGRVQYLSKIDPVPPALEDIRSELANQYYLGYYSPPQAGFHRLRVELPGRNFRIRAKAGYSGS
jgi:Ca-activated chloride channel family protein